MQQYNLVVKARQAGKDGAKTMAADDVRGVVYGREVDSTPISANYQELDKLFADAGTNQVIQLDVDGKTHDVLFKEIQRDPVSNRIQHFDMYAVKKGEKLQAEVPVVLVGDSPAVLRGGQLSQFVETIEVECIPSKIPENFEVDVTGLEEIGDTVHVSDITADPDVTILTDPEQTIAKAEEIRELKVEDDTPAPEAEGEEGEEGEETEGGEGGDSESAEGDDGEAEAAKEDS